MRLKAEEIIQRARRKLDDEVSDFKWDELELIDYLNDSIDEICLRSNVLVESQNESITSYTVTAGEPLIELDNRIIKIKSARLLLLDQSEENPNNRRYGLLQSRPVTFFERYFWNWEEDESDPWAYIPDMQVGYIRLYPKPKLDDTLRLIVTRYPLQRFNNQNLDEYPELPEFHEYLVDGIMKNAFEKDDEDTNNQRKVIYYERRWDKLVNKFVTRYRRRYSGGANVVRIKKAFSGSRSGRI